MEHRIVAEGLTFRQHRRDRPRRAPRDHRACLANDECYGALYSEHLGDDAGGELAEAGSHDEIGLDAFIP